MKQPSTITPSGSHSWLNVVHEQRKNRSIQLGIKTIDSLIKEGVSITDKSIHERPKEIDSEGKGIHSNTIKRNEELYAYYKEYSRTYKVSQVRKKPLAPSTFDEANIRRISPERNVSNVRTKYMKLSKEELVNKLIEVERM